jgi:hypothetical protein
LVAHRDQRADSLFGSGLAQLLQVFGFLFDSLCSLIARLSSNKSRVIARLLHHVGQLVGEESAARRRGGLILVSAEGDVSVESEGTCIDRLRCRMSTGLVMDSYFREITPKSRLEVRALSWQQWSTTLRDRGRRGLDPRCLRPTRIRLELQLLFLLIIDLPEQRLLVGLTSSALALRAFGSAAQWP